MDLAQLLATLLISGYFVVGSRLEERRLIDEHGNRYREYMQQVPGLIPLPWKNITHKEAARIMSQTHPE